MFEADPKWKNKKNNLSELDQQSDSHYTIVEEEIVGDATTR